MRFLVIAITGLTLLAAPVAAKPPLRDVAEVDDALLDLGIADRVRKQCPSISARMAKAINYAWQVKAKARELGYSDAEIESYVKSDAEKERMKARGAAFFKSRGVDTSDPQSYCAFGLQEIQKSSRIGSLLKAK